MTDTILAGLVLAGVTALGVIAYRHPEAYAKIAWPLFMFVTAILLIHSAYRIGYTKGFGDSTLQTLKLNDEIIKTPANPLTGIDTLLWYWLSLGIIVVFRFVPQFLHSSTEPTEPSPEQPETKKLKK